jgi:hypothetical protein
MKTRLLFAFLLTAAAAFAAPVKLTNLQANELLTALTQIGPGLTAQNTTRLAKNINTLRPLVEAWVKGDTAARERLKITAATKTDAPEGVAYLVEVKRNNEDSSTVELLTVSLSDEEITAAKVTPASLSTVLLYLSEVSAKK